MNSPGGEVPQRAESWVGSADAIDAWLRHAQPGEEHVYAHIPRLPHRSATGARARELESQGLVTLFQRAAGPGVFDYIARRRALRAPAAAARSNARPALDGDAARTYAVLRDCARREAPCPTNAEIARKALLRDRLSASYQVRKLVNLKMIEVELIGVDRRVVTIVSTGRRTGASA